MSTSAIKVLNSISVAITTILIPIYGIQLLMGFMYTDAGDSMFTIILTGISVLVSFVCYIGSIVQGLRSISNGQNRTLRSCAIFQMILYVIDMLWIIVMLFSIKNVADSSMRKTQFVYLCIFVVLMIMAISRLAGLQSFKEGTVVEGNSFLSKIYALFIAFPFVVGIMIKVGAALIEKYPVIEKVFGIGCSLIFMGIVAAAMLSVFAFFGRFSAGDVADFSSSGGGMPKAPGSRQTGSGVSNKAVQDFDAKYEREFRKVTGGESPWNYSILKDGPKLEAAKKLRNKMKLEAGKKGFEGKSKYFK